MPKSSANLLDLGITGALMLSMMARRDHQFSQRELAQLLGVHVNSVQRCLALLEGHEVVARSLAPHRGKSGPFYLYQWSLANGGQL